MREGALKTVFFGALEASGLQALSEALARGVPILAYHGVTAGASAGSNLRRLHVPQALFERHLRLLAEHWRPLPLRELVARLKAGEPLPRRAVVLTFDDGYRNFATQAWPLLARYGVPATLFVLTGTHRPRLWQDQLEAAVLEARVPALEWQGTRLELGSPAARLSAAARLVAGLERMSAPREATLASLRERLDPAPPAPDEDRDLLDWDDLRALSAAGLDVGSHADRHQPLTERDPGELQRSLAESHAALVRELGAREYELSYPFGARNATVAQATRQAGFACALTAAPALVRRGTDLFALPRFLVGADDGRARLRASLSGLRGLWQRDPWPARRDARDG